MARVSFCVVCLQSEDDCICDLECPICGYLMHNHDDGECPTHEQMRVVEDGEMQAISDYLNDSFPVDVD